MRVLLAWVAIIAITISPLVGPVVYGSDVNLHFFRLPVVESMWAAGVVYSAWQPTLGHGFGYPLFEFYPPLTSYLYAVVAQVPGLTAPVAFNASFGLAVAVAVVAMGQACRRLFGPLAGVVGPAAYVWAPAFLTQVYERSSLPNVWSLAFCAVALWAAVSAEQRRDGLWWIVAGVALGAMLLSHLVSGLMLAVVWAAMLVAWTRRPWAFGALGLGLLLSAFSWLPALVEIGATQYAGAVTAYLAAQDDFAFAPLWTWPRVTIAGLVNARTPIRVGEAHLVLSGLALLRLATAWQHEAGWRALVATSLGLSALGMFLASAASSVVWERSALLRSTQIPARWLDLCVPGLALTAAWLVRTRAPSEVGARGQPRPGPTPAVGLAVAAIIGLWVMAIHQIYPAYYTARLPDNPTLAHVRQIEERFDVPGLTSWGEYWPAGFAPQPSSDAAVTAIDPEARRQLNPAIRAQVIDSGYNRGTWQLTARASTALAFDIPLTPGWTAKVDGRPLAIAPTTDGRIRLPIPAGESTVELAYTGSQLQQATLRLSLIVSAMAGFVLARRLGLVVLRRVAGRGQRSGPAVLNAHGRTDQQIGPSVLVLTVAGLLLLKLAVLDRIDTPWVRQLPTGLVTPFGSATEPIAVSSDYELVGARRSGEASYDLYWRCLRPSARNDAFSLTVHDPLGREIVARPIPSTGTNLTSRWLPGQIVRMPVTVPDLGPRPYAYTLSIQVVDGLNGHAAEPVPVAELRADPVPAKGPRLRTIDAPAFAGAIRLTGVTLPSRGIAGAQLPVHLRWESLAPVSVDYTVFIHVLDDRGRLMMGQDSQPLDGRYPTSAWAPGARIPETRTLKFPLVAGRFSVAVGLYDLATGQRLVLPDGATSLHLGEIQVEVP